MFDAIYEFFCENQLLTPNQSGFCPGDLTINQLLSVTHKIYSAFEEFPSRETRAVFLDISEAFDEVWHDGLLLKLESYGISGCLLTVIKDFLNNRHQRVVLNGKSSIWSTYNSWGASRLCARSLAFLDIYMYFSFLDIHCLLLFMTEILPPIN